MKQIINLLLAGAATVGLAACSQDFVADSMAMHPTIQIGDRLYAEIRSPRAEDVKRGDLVIFVQPQTPGNLTCMRIVGLPGESIQFTNSGLMINEQQLDLGIQGVTYAQSDKAVYLYGVSAPNRIPNDSVFVVGDNFAEALDSRVYGPIAVREIVAIARARTARAAQITP